MVAKAVVPYSGPDCPIVEPEAAEVVLHAGLDLVLTFQQSLTLGPLMQMRAVSKLLDVLLIIIGHYMASARPNHS